MSAQKKVLTIIGEKAKFHAKRFARECNLATPEIVANLERDLRLAFGRGLAQEKRKQNRHKGQKNLFSERGR
jgi:hypothetical protein